MLSEYLATLQQYRKDKISTFDIKVCPASFTVIIELYQSKGDRFKDFRNADIETALRDAITYIDKNIFYK